MYCIDNIRKLIIESLNTDLQKELDSLIFDISSATSTNINTVFHTFCSIITKTVGKHAPLKKLTRKQGSLQRKAWITKGLLISNESKKCINLILYVALPMIKILQTLL